MAVEGKDGFKWSMACDDLIAELKADIEEFGEDTELWVWSKEVEPGVRLYANYDFKDSDTPLTEDEKWEAGKRGERISVMKAGELLPLLIKQNEVT